MPDVHVEFTIPGIVWWLLLDYYLIGWALLVPLVLVQARYISPRRYGLDAFHGIRWALTPLWAWCWPVTLAYTLRDVKRYGWR